MVTETKDTIVLGGGLSGIGYLYSNKDALLIEKNSKLFGHARSKKFENFFFDQGAHICHSKDEKWRQLIGFENLNEFTSSDVSNLKNGRWIGYPVQNNLKDIDERDIAFKEIKDCLQVKPRTDNYENWCFDVYGKHLTEEYYRKFTSKYWRTNMKDMSTEWLSGRIMPIDFKRVIAGYKGKSTSQAVFNKYYYPPDGGFEALFSKIKSKLAKGSYILDSKVVHIDLEKKLLYLECGKKYNYKKLISSLPITEFIKISNLNFNSEVFKYNNLILTGIVAKGSADSYPDWFYVYDQDIEFSRVMNISKVQKKVKNELALQFETFRRCDEQYNFIELTKKIENDICALLSQKKENMKIFHKKIDYSFVVPTHGIKKHVMNIKQSLKKFNVHLIGLYGNWEYVWSDAAFMQGFNYE